MRLGQTFHSYATMISRDRDRLTKVRTEMYPVNMGATAIGTAINTSPFYLDNIVPTLGKITGYPLTQADDLFDATENLDRICTRFLLPESMCGQLIQNV